jgi:hypothetical protein
MILEELFTELIKEAGTLGVAATALYYWNRRLEKQIERLRKERNKWRDRTLEKHQETMDEFQEQGNLMDELYQELKQRQASN